MKRALLVWVLLGSIVAVTRASVPAQRYWVCVTNEQSGDLTIIDGATRRTIATIPLGKRPRGIHASPDGRRLYVALSGSPNAGPPSADERPLPPIDRSADGIAIVDLARRAKVRMLPSGVDPIEFAVSHDGKRLFIANEETAMATMVRVADGKVLHTERVSEEPEGVEIALDGRTVFVTCEADGMLWMLDARNGHALGHVTVGGRPRSVALAPGGRRAYVPSETTAELHVVDPTAQRVIATYALPPGSRPMKVLRSSDARSLYISNGLGGTIAVLDAARGTLRDTVRVGARPWGMALAPDGRWLWVANGPSNDVSVVDLVERREVARIPAGEGPWGITIVARR